jgi:hypothetical protein
VENGINLSDEEEEKIIYMKRKNEIDQPIKIQSA